MNLTLLTFGSRLENHYQASFAILTFLHDALIEKVIVVTDRPDFYHFLGERVEILPINSNTLTQWQGEFHFFWRVKIKALQAVQQRYPEQDLIYVDSDVFLAKSLAGIQQQLQQGHSVMHLCEGRLSEPRNRSWRKMYRTLHGKSFAGIRIDKNTAMWNAGVIALPASQAQSSIELALQICDEICAEQPHNLAEQFAFSLALSQLGLQPCDEVIGHYWGNKTEWNQFIANFFVNAQLKQLSLQECINQLAQQDWTALPLEKKQRNTNAKLQKFIDKLFPAKKVRYFSV